MPAVLHKLLKHLMLAGPVNHNAGVGMCLLYVHVWGQAEDSMCICDARHRKVCSRRRCLPLSCRSLLMLASAVYGWLPKVVCIHDNTKCVLLSELGFIHAADVHCCTELLLEIRVRTSCQEDRKFLQSTNSGCNLVLLTVAAKVGVLM